MKNFNFSQESNNLEPRINRHPRARHHHEPNSPTGDGGYREPDGPEFGAAGPRGGRGGGRGERDFGRGSEHGERRGGRGAERDERDDRGGRGGGPGGGRGFGGGFGGPGGRGFGGPGFGGPGGGRVRRGNVRSAILSLLGQHSLNGYGLIRAISIHTDGAWRPSPGSIYPALTALQAEGFIESTGATKRTEYSLTEAGRAYVAENSAEMAQVWADVNEEAGAGKDLRSGMGKLAGAVQQISLAGTEEQIKTATEALDTARRAIYKLLAD